MSHRKLTLLTGCRELLTGDRLKNQTPLLIRTRCEDSSLDPGKEEEKKTRFQVKIRDQWLPGLRLWCEKKVLGTQSQGIDSLVVLGN